MYFGQIRNKTHVVKCARVVRLKTFSNHEAQTVNPQQENVLCFSAFRICVEYISQNSQQTVDVREGGLTWACFVVEPSPLDVFWSKGHCCL